MASGTLVVPRSRGVLTGLLLLALGAWGGLIPFIGPYFGYAYTPDTPWVYTAGRLWLEILPAAAVIVGALLLMGSANRANASLGGWLATAGGAWFVVGTLLTPFWSAGAVGEPVGSAGHQALVQIGFFYGLGAAVMFLSGMALGRLAVRGVRDVELAEARQAEREQARQRAAEPYPSEREVTRTDERAGEDRGTSTS